MHVFFGYFGKNNYSWKNWRKDCVHHEIFELEYQEKGMAEVNVEREIDVEIDSKTEEAKQEQNGFIIIK